MHDGSLFSAPHGRPWAWGSVFALCVFNGSLYAAGGTTAPCGRRRRRARDRGAVRDHRRFARPRGLQQPPAHHCACDRQRLEGGCRNVGEDGLEVWGLPGVGGLEFAGGDGVGGFGFAGGDGLEGLPEETGRGWGLGQCLLCVSNFLIVFFLKCSLAGCRPYLFLK